MRKPDFAYVKTKTQISFAVTAKLISAFVFATRIVQSLYFLNFMPLAILCGCTDRLCRTWSETPKTGFLTTRPIYTITCHLCLTSCRLPVFPPGAILFWSPSFAFKYRKTASPVENRMADVIKGINLS